MTDDKNTGDKTLHAPSKTLSLKRPVEAGVVRQSFSHGRSKAVVVEKVKRRTLGPGEQRAEVKIEPKVEAPAPVAAAPVAAPAAPVAKAAAPAPAAPAPAARAPAGRGAPQRSSQGNRPSSGSGVVLRTLTEDERDARTQALVEARKREIEERAAAEIEAKVRAEREAIEKVEREAAAARQKEEDERLKREEDVRRKSEEAAQRLLGDAAPAADAGLAKTAPSGPQSTKPLADTGLTTVRRPLPAAGVPGRLRNDEEEEARTVRRPGGVVRPAVAPKPERTRGTDDRRRGRLTVTAATGGGDEERTRSLAAFRRRVQRLKGHQADEPKEKIAREVIIPETITIQELANRMAERAVDVIRFLMKQGQMVKITDVIDADTAQLVAEELGHTVKRVAESDVEEGLFDEADADTTMETRSPVVTIMGHVDHGKTSLLDALRKTNVVSGEAGGITQHIGAYQVVSPLGGKITFIDTPGHAAFTAMRARGAKVTDIVILVVAADDGVMPQTIEAINHAKAAGVPMIVAINKIDKPAAKPERVRTELLQYEVQVESMGGETIEVEVSAKERTNLDKLLEMITLQAEVLDLKANPHRPAEGTVIEAKLDRGRGPVATVLVQRGTLHPGDIVVAGSEWGRVRALLSENGSPVTDAGPSVPVEILGFNGAPEAGDRVAVVENEARAREISAYRQRQKRERSAARQGTARGTLADMMSQLKTAGRKEFTLLVKGDVQGSVEAIIGALDKAGNEEVMARVMHAGVGGINESDITLAEASHAVVIGFNVRANKEAREAAERAGIEIRYYNIIYDLVDDIKKAMSGLLAPTLREESLGEARILQVFGVSKIGKVAGCLIQDGRVERGASVRLIRDNVVIHEGKLSTLKRFKDEVKEVGSGQECGMAFENYQDMREGDIIECYRVEEIRRSL